LPCYNKVHAKDRSYNQDINGIFKYDKISYSVYHIKNLSHEGLRSL